MARVGITKEQVHAAANQLLSQGVTPGINAVRAILGTGSNGTIQKFLREWADARPVQQAAAFTLPADLNDSFARVIERERAAAAAEAQEKRVHAEAQADTLADDVERLEGELDAEREALAALTTERDQLNADLGALRLELKQLELHLQGEQQAKNAAHLELASARLKTEAQAEQITALTAALGEAKQTAEAAEQARRDAEASSAAQRVKAESEKGRADELARRLVVVEQQATEAMADARQAHDDAKQAATEATTAKLAVKDAEATAAAADARAAAAEVRATAAEAQAAAVAQALDTAKAETDALREQLAAATSADTELKQLAIGLEKPKK